MTKFFYRVEQGDTLLSVSNKIKVAPSRLISLNNLTQEIAQGDLLYVEKPKTQCYKVMPLDTPTSIAKKFDIDQKELLEKNGVDYVFYGLVLEI